MTVYVAVKCGVGKEQCEDAVLVGDSLVCDDEAEAEFIAPTTGVICVADGVGGNAGGHFASTFVVNHMKNNGALSNRQDLQQLLLEINTALISAGSANGLPAAATTLTGVIFADGQQNLVHIGNTRAYVLQGKYLKQLTSDHTVHNRLLKMGRIDEADRSNRNEITNCFGGGKASLLDRLVISEIQDFNTLLLTTDGVHDYIGIDDLERLLTSEALGVTTCNNIVQAALEAGSKDDISVVIVQK